MKRIGIIGTENSHALHFAKGINLGLLPNGERQYADLKVVACFGPDLESAKQLRDEAAVELILDKPEDFLGKVDAMMITSRKGSHHLAYAKLFVEAGIPLFIDKPVTADPDEAEELISLAKQHNVLITGGSGCKYAWDVQLLKIKREQWEKEGRFLSASANFAADIDSPYDGFYFYAPHLTEMALTIFGYDVQAVQSVMNERGVTVIFRYAAYDISLHYTKGSNVSSCVLYGTSDNEYRRIDISQIYGQELEMFVRMLGTSSMPQTYDQLTRHVYVIDAILASLDIGREVKVKA